MTPPGRWARSALALVAALLLGTGACSDDGPEGPGAWAGLVRTSTAPPGAVILTLQGPGIRGVEGEGAVEAFAHRVGSADSGSETWRVVLVSPTPGTLGFRVSVDDIGADAPRAVVVSAVDGEDQPLTSVSSFSVQLSR